MGEPMQFGDLMLQKLPKNVEAFSASQFLAADIKLFNKKTGESVALTQKEWELMYIVLRSERDGILLTSQAMRKDWLGYPGKLRTILTTLGHKLNSKLEIIGSNYYLNTKLTIPGHALIKKEK